MIFVTTIRRLCLYLRVFLYGFLTLHITHIIYNLWVRNNKIQNLPTLYIDYWDSRLCYEFFLCALCLFPIDKIFRCTNLKTNKQTNKQTNLHSNSLVT